MSLPILPTNTEALVDDQRVTTLPWLSFFDAVASGDGGTTWTPTFTGLTEVGTATKTGRYYQISRSLVYFRIVITPATNTSATAGTTYCDNFPLNITAAGAAMSLSGATAALAGVTSSPKRIYTGSWSLLTTPVTITGLIEAN